MTPPPVHRLHALLEAAAHRLKLAARASAERTVESLGLAALAAHGVFQRDALLGAQFELNRKSAMFALAFGECLDDKLRQDSAPRQRAAAETAWDALGLVEDTEVERKISADRFGMEVQHACEWELRELEGYIGSLLGPTVERNPLRPETVGLALLKGIEAVSDRTDVRSLLQSELGRVLALEMRATYAAIVADLRKAGVQPAGLSVRATIDRSRQASTYDSLRDAGDSLHEMLPQALPEQRAARGLPRAQVAIRPAATAAASAAAMAMVAAAAAPPHGQAASAAPASAMWRRR